MPGTSKITLRKNIFTILIGLYTSDKMLQCIIIAKDENNSKKIFLFMYESMGIDKD
jgi:hypothetical protein